MNDLLTLTLFDHQWQFSIITLYWVLFGLVGNVLFTARVVLQWLASEKAGRTVVPVAFWWMSLLAAIIHITYASYRADIPMILGLAVTLVPYLRNLRIHYRPDRPARSLMLIVPLALILALITPIVSLQTEVLRSGLFYFGLLGNAVYRSRFFVQWVQSERERKSVMKLPFWYLSLSGCAMLLLYSLLRHDPVFILSFLFNIIPYIRNIMLIHKQRRAAIA